MKYDPKMRVGGPKGKKSGGKMPTGGYKPGAKPGASKTSDPSAPTGARPTTSTSSGAPKPSTPFTPPTTTTTRSRMSMAGPGAKVTGPKGKSPQNKTAKPGRFGYLPWNR